jgi:methyl-accepting chemotaxis protein
MNEVKQTTKEIKNLRKAFQIEYSKFKSQFDSMEENLETMKQAINGMGTRLYELSKQADLLLSVIEQLNETEMDVNKLEINL